MALHRIGPAPSDAGVSVVVGVVLMLALTVITAAVVYVWVGGFGEKKQDPELLGLRQVSCREGTSAQVKATIASATSNFRRADLRITDAQNSSTSFSITGGSDPLAAGDTLTLTPTGSFSCRDTLFFIHTASETIAARMELRPTALG